MLPAAKQISWSPLCSIRHCGAEGSPVKIRSLALVLFVLIGALLAMELVLTCGYPCYFADDVRAYCYSPELGYRLKDSLCLRRSTDYQKETCTNKIGTVNFQDDFSKCQRLVFAVGDSFTQGVGVPADASYPFQLDLLLNLKGDAYYPRYGVVNLGVGGYGTEQALLQIKRYQKQIGTPRYILLLGNETDFRDDQNFRSGRIRRKMLEGNPRYSPLLIGSLQWLQYETEIGKRLTLLLRNERDRAAKLPQTLDGVELQKPVLQKFINLSKEMHATLIVSWFIVYWTRELSPNYGALKQYAAENNLAFADWYPLVSSVLENNPHLPATNAHSAGHYRTWINQMIARAFARQIEGPPVPAGN
jgi:lysophospholipase L1-like esterase